MSNLPKVSKNDHARLSPHLSGSRKIADLFMLDTISTLDLRKLLATEAKRDRPRVAIVRRLLGRIYTRQYWETYKQIFPNATP
mgnify:CR=1 FL=1